MKYAFILGREPALSTAEIIACLKSEGLNPDPRACLYSPTVLIVEVEQELKPEFFFNLGGSLKFAEVLGGSLGALEDDLFDILSGLENPSLDFGLSLYATEPALSSGYRNLMRGLRPLSLTLKKRLKEYSEKSIRVVLPDGPALTAVQVDKNKLIEKGAELLILVGQGAVQIAKTIAVQDFEDFAERDFGRPKADALSGMLPPKLARMMVNLTGAPKTAALLDPFCGSGTILTEAIAIGHQAIIASDVSEKAVTDTRTNVEWMLKRTGFRLKSLKIFESDVKDLAEHLAPNTVEAISSEPFLGPPLRGYESDQALHHVLLELMGLYRRAFAAYAKVLKPGSPVVFVFPVLGTSHVNILSELRELGFTAEALLPGRAAEELGLKTPVGLIYRRLDQRVGREIFRFRFKG